MRDAVRLHSCQTLTPETETSTHYFFQQSHRAGEGDERIVQSIYDSLVGAFEEDRAMITAQARNIARNPDAHDAAAGDGRGAGSLPCAPRARTRRRGWPVSPAA